MHMTKTYFSIITTLVLLTAGVSAQAPTTAATAKPTNESALSIQSIVPNSAGINVGLTAYQVQLVGASLEKQNPTTGNWVPVINYFYFPLPAELFSTRDATSGTVALPIIVQADPAVIYRMSFFTKSKDDEQMDWNNAMPFTFKGYTSAVSQTFKIDFTSDALKVSTTTSNVATLTAAWQFPGQNPVSVQQSTESQSPQVSLSFAALQASDGATPSLVLTLVDKATNQRQEARLTLTVASTTVVNRKVSQAASASNPSKASLSWGDLAKTGISAILKYFTKV